MKFIIKINISMKEYKFTMRNKIEKKIELLIIYLFYLIFMESKNKK